MAFGKNIEGINYKVLDERVMRGSAGIMLMLAFIAFANGFILREFIVIPYIAGFLALNFIIGIFISSKFAPTILISQLIVKKQTPIYIGAIQKKFAWSLGLTLSTAIFILSLFLIQDVTYFEPVCMLCLICIALLYLETAFGICVGCKLYDAALKLKLFKALDEKQNCMGNSCENDTEN